jgi:hypothetical protein
MGIKEEASAIVNVKSMMVDLIFGTIVRSILLNKSYISSAREVEELKEMINTHLKLLGAFIVRDYIPFLGWLDLQRCEREMKKLAGAGMRFCRD